MADAALRYAGGGSHRLWLVAAHQAAHWRARAALLQCGMLALAAPPTPDAGAAPDMPGGSADPDTRQPRRGDAAAAGAPSSPASAPALTWAAAAAAAAAPAPAAARAGGGVGPGACGAGAAPGAAPGAPGVAPAAAGRAQGVGAAGRPAGRAHAPAQGPAGLPVGGAALRAEQVVDLGLRLLHLLSCVPAGAAGAWVAALAAEPGGGGAAAARGDSAGALPSRVAGLGRLGLVCVSAHGTYSNSPEPTGTMKVRWGVQGRVPGAGAALSAAAPGGSGVRRHGAAGLASRARPPQGADHRVSAMLRIVERLPIIAPQPPSAAAPLHSGHAARTRA